MPPLRRALVALVVLAIALGTAPASAHSYQDTAVAAWQTNGTGVVRDIISIGGTVYVGGSFTAIRASAGSPAVAQPYLAAFDATTGVHVAGFAPVLDGEVRAIAPAPDGSAIYVGGLFDTVNGQSRTGIVALDPLTGATITAFTASTDNDVLEVVVDGADLYLGGRFLNVGAAPRMKVARLDRVTGAPDPSWVPEARNGGVYSIAVEPTRDRVYIGGTFGSISGVPNSARLAAVTRGNGSVVTSFDPGPGFEVFDVAATGDKVYAALGGPGGRLEIYDATSAEKQASFFADGDVQTIELAGDRVYVGGHQEAFFGPYNRPWVVELDPLTDAAYTDFAPSLSMGIGSGVWALHATDDHLWLGGALESASPVDGVGFARFPVAPADPADAVDPSVPTGLQVVRTADVSVELTWNPSTDNSGNVGYLIERNGTVIGTWPETSYRDETVQPNTAYTYRIIARDPSDNRSNASGPATTTTLAPLTAYDAFEFGSTWRYLDTGTAPGAAWQTPAFDDSAWPAGPGQLGVGDGDEATVLASRTAVFFRKDVVLPAGAAVGEARLRLVIDDGAVVYVNGTEVARDNMPAGPAGHTTPAVFNIVGGQEAAIHDISVDGSLFTGGTNVIAVSLHNVPGSFDLSFDAALDLRLDIGDCDGRSPTVALALGQSPTSGPDVILGTEGDDVIAALGGNDVICAGGGNDTIDAGSGFDTVFAGDGNDSVIGGNGNDTVHGGEGNDRIWGGSGNDVLNGDGGDDNINGQTNGDVIDGGEGNDFLRGAEGFDTIDGGDGNDRIYGDANGDTLRGGPGADGIFGGDGGDTIDGGDTADTISGNSGNDTIFGGGGNDTIYAGSGADNVDGGSGIDIVDGQEDNDVVNGGSANGDTVRGGTGADQLAGGPGTNDSCDGGVDTSTDTADASCETTVRIP